MPKTQKHDIWHALIIVVGSLFVAPAIFAYFVVSTGLRDQNICHVGPVHLVPTSDVHLEKFNEQRASLISLYGSYTSFDDASYYFVKTPYDISPQVLPDFGYWSITTLALTLLSPKLRQNRQDTWKNGHDLYNVNTAPSIQWDQSHQIQYTTSKEHSSKSNRWCLLSHQDPKKYYNDQSTPALFDTKEPVSVSLQNHNRNSVLFKICAQPQTSILSSGDQSPYFVELPLQPPMPGIWKMLEFPHANQETKNSNDDESDPTNTQQRVEPTNPYQLQVQCHVGDMELQHLARGSLQLDSQPRLGWEHADLIKLPRWNIFWLPGTLYTLLILLLVQLRRLNSRLSLHSRQQDERNLVESFQNIWCHTSWHQWSLSAFWVYLLGIFLEPLIGTMPYVCVTMLLLQLVALVKGKDERCNNFMWICFGQSVLLSQLEPTLRIGSLEIAAISVGDSAKALNVNVVSVVVMLFLLLQSSLEKTWCSVLCCLFLGWGLANPLTMELLCAPQWTIPLLLLAHLWLKLVKMSDNVKKTDESATLCENGNQEETTTSAADDEESAFSFTSADQFLSLKGKILKCTRAIGAYFLFSLWFILTAGCIFSLDWTLVVGHMLTLWLNVGSMHFPRHHLWSLYHMVASSVLIVINVMTLTGWYLCHVAIITRALHVLAPRYVYMSLAFQTTAHFCALLHTVCTKHWETSRQVPGHYFWCKVRVLGEEIRLWYYVFYC